MIPFSKEPGFYAISIAIYHNSFTVAIIQLSSLTIVYETTVSNPAGKADLILTHLLELFKKNDIQVSTVRGIGITIPAFFRETNNHNYAVPQYWELFVETISNYLKIPVYIENTSAAISLAELAVDKTLSSKVIMVLNLGWELELGLIINGSLYGGSEGLAGQFGHNLLFNNQNGYGPKYESLNSIASLRAIKMRLSDPVLYGSKTGYLTDEKLSEHNIITNAKKGDYLTVEIIRDAAEKIGQELSKVAHIIYPDKIILSGLGGLTGNVWLDPMKRTFNQCFQSFTGQHVNFIVSKNPKNAQLLGGAVLVEKAVKAISIKKHKMVKEICLN